MILWVWTTILALLIYAASKIYARKTYFKRLGLIHPDEVPFFGYLGWNMMRKRHCISIVKELYNKYRDAKYIGCHVFSTPYVYVRDPELIKSVLVKDFECFSDHKEFVDEAIDPLFGRNLVFKNGERWREIRHMLSPSFTASKMRSMYELMCRCADHFSSRFLELYGGEEAIDVKDAFSRYTNDVIATCAFGLEIDSLVDKENDFYVRGHRCSVFSGLARLKLLAILMFPEFIKKLKLRVISKEDTEFFYNVIEKTIRTREEEGITRPDMLQLMMEARSKTSDFDVMDITSQAFVFFLGGFETTSGQMSMMAHELATNLEVQNKLQEEIDAMMKECDGKPSYEAVNNLQYLDAVFRECMRLHSFPFINRVCSRDFEFPAALPGAKPFTVRKGMEILIPVAAVHSDPDFYENPEKFDPERFLRDPSKKVTSDVFNLGFGLGPRICIGSRFALLETKVMFVYLLSRCSLRVCNRTCVPLQYDYENFAAAPKGGAWLRVELRE